MRFKSYGNEGAVNFVLLADGKLLNPPPVGFSFLAGIPFAHCRTPLTMRRYLSAETFVHVVFAISVARLRCPPL